MVFHKQFKVLIAVVCIATSSLFTQDRPEQKDMTVSAAMRSEVIENILQKLNKSYVFPDKAAEMEKAVRQRLKDKEYDSITSAREFAQKLTADLREISHDKHLRVNYFAEARPDETGPKEPTDEEKERELRFSRMINFGFEKIERMRGNIGYLDLRGFFEAETGGPTAAAAMNFLTNTDALIIDLRQNGGGAPGMVALICSYFFSGEPVHLNDLYWRPTNTTQQWWTFAYVPGERYLKKDVYILTSSRTFSAAEEFTYNMKNLKRATVVGETTGGGAHPGEGVRLSDHFGAFIPTGRAINPITKTNWEGTGVTPDISVPADQALKAAYIDALKKRIAQTQDMMLKQQWQQLVVETQKELEEMKAKK